MKKEKACKKCKIITEKEKCPLCEGTEFTESWKGRMIIFDTEKSEIAQKLKIKQPGDYAIKT
ncbi:MAG: DNA-directed RNA polymerase subunit E'' [Candidatus Pacearchaeota archaeon]|nr:DNA-directed RNA polymerase subunit E'' [Candidatus Pacearchaeota archaeon]